MQNVILLVMLFAPFALLTIGVMFLVITIGTQTK